MKIYELECLNTDGDIERNGLFISRENAEIEKAKLDNEPYHLKFGVKQHIVVNETEDNI